MRLQVGQYLFIPYDVVDIISCHRYTVRQRNGGNLQSDLKRRTMYLVRQSWQKFVLFFPLISTGELGRTAHVELLVNALRIRV